MASPHDSQPEPTSLPEQAPGSVVDLAGEPAVESVAAAGASFETRAWALTLALSLAAGLIAWACTEMMLVPEIGAGKRGGPVRVLPNVPATRNAIVSFGILGAALGLSLGLAGGLLRRSVLWTVQAATMGLVLGGLAGAGVAWLTIPIYYQHVKSDDLAYSLLVHGGPWTAIGTIAGLAFGFGRGGWDRMRRCLVGAGAGALLATVIYEFGGMMLFPMAMTDRPLSKTSETRLLAQLLVAAMVAAGALFFGSPSTDRPRR